MTYTEVLELIRAGFKKEEIEALMKAEKSPVPDKKPEPEKKPTEPEKVTAKEPEKEPEPYKKPEPSETEKLVAALGLKFDALTSAIQKSNVGSIEGSEPKDTTNDIIARIINPHFGEG